ncbi:MAG: motility protein A [Spirochaetia bacterium]|jgi:chemotaxis protein MotA|nr:motility protein A [Spirochaetia bacterium]
MDIATIGGIAGGVVCILAGIILARGDLMLFFDPASILITVAGSFCTLITSNPINYVVKITSIARLCFFAPEMNPKDMIVTLVSFSEKARREGLLALEDDLNELNDDFLKKGIQLVVDGTDPELVRRIMETELEYIMERHDRGKKLFDDWGFLAPAFGMIGTLLGLILMMANLEDKAAIGPGMATALITTLYGSILANVLFIPLANKLAVRGNEEILVKLIMIEGTLSIQAGDNPRIVRDKLVAFLEPAQRDEITQEVGD